MVKKTETTVKEGIPSQVKETTEAVSSQTIIKESNNDNVLYMDSYTTCKNLCTWDIFFALSQGGDKTIKANGTLDILNRDIISLCSNSNIFFSGTDGIGSHARIKIMNPLLRKHVGFDSEDEERKQILLDEETLNDIFSSKTQKEFEKKVKQNVVEYHEKDIIVKYAKRIKENDYNKIDFIEEYTGKKFKEQ